MDYLPRKSAKELMSLSRFAVLGAISLLSACASAPPRIVNSSSTPTPLHDAPYNRVYWVHGHRYHVLPACAGYQQRGIASWYGPGFNGRRTSTGAVYNMYAYTAASKVLPLPCWVRVTNLRNGREVVVKVNDRGPFVANRILDLSYGAARALGMIQSGTAIVEVQAVDPALPAANPPPPPSEAQGAPVPRLFLQVGAFSDQERARRLVTALRDMGFGPVRLAPLLAEPRQALYAVRIGPLANVNALDEAARRMRKVGIKGFKVRVE